MARTKKKTTTPKRRNRPDDIKDVIGLQEYLLQHPLDELPFVQACWDKAVEKTEENKAKEIPKQIKVIEHPDGTREEKVVHGGNNLVLDPVKMYFRLISLPVYKKAGEALLRQYALDDGEQDIYRQAIESVTGEDSYGQYANEVVGWINTLRANEKAFLMRRYAAYSDTYEINPAADSAMLKRLLSLELEAHRIDTLRAEGKSVNINDEKKVTEMLDSAMSSLKMQKKQNSDRDKMAQAKFTVFMDGLMKDGSFKPPKIEYEKDALDEQLDIYLDCMRQMLS